MRTSHPQIRSLPSVRQLRPANRGADELLRGDEPIVPGVSVKVFPGHTEHMQAVIVTSGGKTGRLHFGPDSTLGAHWISPG